MDYTQHTLTIEELTERFEELESSTFTDGTATIVNGTDGEFITIEDLDEDDLTKYAELDDDVKEYVMLKGALYDLQGCGGDYQWRGDWYPAQLISDGYFEDYAQELAEEIGAISKQTKWPLNCIDWAQAAKELKYDYSYVTLDENDFFFRN